MIDNSNSDTALGPRQKFFLVVLSFILVVSLFFFRTGFKANEMLDQLAKNSLEPEIALSNGKPTVFEFYADWCEACKEMAPDMIKVETLNSNQIDLVLLNVDNSRWFDLIEKYDENGLAQLPSEIIDLAKGYVDGINYFAKQNPAKVNRKMHPVSIRDVLLGSHIQHLLFAGLFREIESLNNFEISAEVPTGSNAVAVNGKKTIQNSSYLMILSLIHI